MFKLILNSRFGEFFRFCIIGSINTFINYLTYLILLYFISSHYLLAGAIGFATGAVFGFFLNRKWAFKATHVPTKMITLYLLVNLISMGINVLVQFVVVHYLGINKAYSQIFGILITIFTNYIGVKVFVFKNSLR